MNKFIKCLNSEIEYMIKSKILMFLVIIFITISGIVSFIQYTYVTESYDDYNKMVQYYNENDLDIQGDLDSDEYYITENADGTTTVENPILYLNDQMCRAIYSISPQYAVSQTFEISILFLPILFFIIGSVIAAKDYKYKITKHHILRFGRTNYFLSKVLIIFLTAVLSICVLACISKILSIIFTSILSSQIPFDKFDVGNISTASSIPIKIILMIFFSFMYSMMGALFGTIFKNPVPGIAIAVLYLYILPIKLTFEPKNMVYLIMKKYFDFLGPASISSTIDFSILLSFIILSSLIIISGVIIAAVTYKRSAYN